MIRLMMILTLILFSNTFADRRREAIQEEESILKAREELVLYRQKFEDLRVNRWQDKRNVVAKKEAFQSIFNDVKYEVEKLQTNRTQKEETLNRIQKQVEESKVEKDELQMRLREFGVQVSAKLNEFAKALVTSYPLDLIKQQSNTEELILELQNTDFRIDNNKLTQLFSQQLDVYKNNEARTIERTSMPMQGFAQMMNGANEKLATKMVAGHKLSLGGIYQGFVSSETSDAAILAKTGRIDSRAWDWVESLLPEKRAALNKVGEQLSLNNVDEPLLIPIDVQMRKAVGEGYSSTRVSTFWKDLIEELKGAGFVIYGMGFLAFLAIWILADKVRIFSYRGRQGKKFSEAIFKLLDENRLDDAIHHAKLYEGSVPYIFRSVLKGVKKGKSREDIENIAFERILHETPIVEKNIGTINIFAAAAPLLGLLGTVSGMVNLFAAITLHGTSDPKIMAAGIAEALLSTKWGLIVAIPMLLMYNYAKNQSEKIISNMEKYTARLVNHLYGTTGETK